MSTCSVQYTLFETKGMKHEESIIYGLENAFNPDGWQPILNVADISVVNDSKETGKVALIKNYPKVRHLKGERIHIPFTPNAKVNFYH